MKKQIFGTDGIRGPAGKDMLSAEKCLLIGKAMACRLKHKAKDEKTKIIIGKDTRISSDMIENALTAGATSAGAIVLKAGILPTPAVAFLTKTLNADAGIMVSDSHNSYEDNGIKFFSEEGFKLPDQKEAEIETLLLRDPEELPAMAGAEIGFAEEIKDSRKMYADFLLNSVGTDISFSGIKVVLDCANGAAYKIAPDVLEKTGARVITINNNPDGININQKCGATDIAALSARVKKESADIGIALDGDADRIICVDENGDMVDGDTIIGICALDLKEKNMLPGNRVVITVMSNMGLEVSLKKHGIHTTRTRVGDRYVIEEMLKTGSVIGGEPSGHIIFNKANTTGDGIMAALYLLKYLKENQKPFSELCNIFSKYPQSLINVMVAEKRPIEHLPEIEAVINKYTEELDEKGRILVRYSGTEPKMRIMAEGENAEQIEKITHDIADKVKEHIGV